MKKLYSKDVSKQCDVCRFGRLSEDGQSVLCPKRGITQRDDKCRKFSYDATKREPVIPAELPEYSSDDFKL